MLQIFLALLILLFLALFVVLSLPVDETALPQRDEIETSPPHPQAE